MSFYDRYPQPEMEKENNPLKKLISYGGVLLVLSPLLIKIYRNDNENISDTLIFNFKGIEISYLHLMVASFIIFFLIAENFFKKKGKKLAYLKKYGKKEDVKCEKIEEKGFITSICFYFYIEGREIIIKEFKTPKELENRRVLTEESIKKGDCKIVLTNEGVREGDTVPFIYNPEDPTDYIIDYEKLLIK